MGLAVSGLGGRGGAILLLKLVAMGFVVLVVGDSASDPGTSPPALFFLPNWNLLARVAAKSSAALLPGGSLFSAG